MMGDGFLFGATAAVAGLVNVCWAHPADKQGQRSSDNFFHGVIPDAFEVRRIVCVEN